MKPIFRPAAFLAVLAFALAARAIPSPSAPAAAPPSAPAPAIVAQVEIRGLAQLADTVERIAGPAVLPAGQIRAMATMLAGIDPVALFGDTPSPVRAIVYTLPGATEPGVLFDVPAAGDDVSAFFDRLAGVATAEDIPEAAAAKLPGGSRLFRLAQVSGDNRLLALPHGGRVALLPFALREGLKPAQAPRLLSAARSPAPEGVLAVSADSDALFPLIPQLSDAGDDGDDVSFGRAWPIQKMEAAIGLDDADRLRFAGSFRFRPGTLEARQAAALGEPAPLANAVLLPGAIAAVSSRSTSEGLSEADFLSSMRAGWALRMRSASADERAVLEKGAALYAKWLAALSKFAGAGYACALFPADGEKRCPWAFCALTDDAAALLEAIPSLLADACRDFAAFGRDVSKDGGDGKDDLFDADEFAKADFRAEPVGEREVAGARVRTIALRLTDPDTGHVFTLATFDAAAFDSALLVANLADGALSGVIADLVSGETARAPLAEMPAFREAYGATPPAGAAAGFVQLVPAAQTVLRALKARGDELEAEEKAAEEARPDDGGAEADAENEEADGAEEEDEKDDEPFFGDGMLSFLDATDLPACPIALTERHDEAADRTETVLVFPVADLRALHGRLAPLFRDDDAPAAEDDPFAGEEEDGEEAEGDDFGDW